MSPFRIALLFGFAAIVGLACLPLLSVDFVPSDRGLSFTVSYRLDQQPPLVVEQELTAPLENHLSQLTGLQKIYSVSNYGSGFVSLTFDPDVDIAFKEMEINGLLRQFSDLLPTNAGGLSVRRSSHEEKRADPMLIYELRYTGDDSQANDWLQTFLLPRLNGLPDIREVSTSGTKQYAWKVAFDADKLKTHGLDHAVISQRIASISRPIQLGHTLQQGMQLPVHYTYMLSTPADLTHLHIHDQLKLGDIASVEKQEDRIRQHLRINGQEAIFLSIYTHEHTNKTAASQQISQYVRSLGDQLPEGYSLAVNYDDTIYLHRELNKAWTRAGISLIVISLLILLTTLNFRYLVVLLSTIVVTLSLTIGLSAILSINIHLYTLAGLTISAGLLVDNAIVLIDHIRKTGNIKILTAQLAASLTTIASLMVMWVLPREYRTDLSEFGMIIMLVLGVSFFTCWWFAPACAKIVGLDSAGSDLRRIGKVKRLIRWQSRYHQVIYFLGRHRKWLIPFLVLLFGTPIFLLPSKIEGQPWYNDTIGSDVYQEDVRPWVDRLTGGALRMFYRDVYENSGYRTPQQTKLYVNAQLPYGHTLAQMDAIIRDAESFIGQFDQVNKFVTRVYSARQAQITIEFDEAVDSSFPHILKNRIIQQSLDWGGVDWGVYGVGRGFSNASSASLPGFKVQLRGYHYDKLGAIADQMANKLLQHKRIQSVNTNSELSWDQESFEYMTFRADGADQRYKATAHLLGSLAPQPYPVAHLQSDGTRIPIYVESANAHQLNSYDVQHLSAGQIPLRSQGTLVKTKTVNAVHKEDRQYIRGLAFDYYGSHRFGKKYLDEVIDDMDESLPPGFSIKQQEWSWGQDEEKRKYELLILLAVLIYFISTIFLENFRYPLFIILTIPLSLIGLFLTFALGGFQFDQGGYAAFLMIGGLSVNAIIFICGDFISLRKSLPHNRALTKAIRRKAWAILMTVISTCAGLVPFLIHGDQEIFWFSLAIGTIGGLIFSLIVIFVFLPALMIRSAT